MSSDLDHLTEEERKTVLSIYPKEIKDIEKTEPVIDEQKQISPNVAELPVTKEQKEDWKDGYTDYEKKTKDSERVSYEDNEIEIIEDEF